MSHAYAIAHSIHLIKKQLLWKQLVVRSQILLAELSKPDLWNDPWHAGKISREHGSVMGKVKEVTAFEHIDMIKLTREKNDTELELVQYGAGGNESMDWATMVLNMYRKPQVTRNVEAYKDALEGLSSIIR